MRLKGEGLDDIVKFLLSTSAFTVMTLINLTVIKLI